ncbi:hypothetical protein LTR56_015009 [Elasticomyces elasticus]|nr:hypothetical protein LTR56_015009 [Elasticomyces elasticus]KAK3646973.1 hypothetical protein LTR22_014000 [Elasticomyces elasticus]KAK4916952.1 hypothetical protein LTR49_015127 [Elasticomyces elasticus]
MPVEPIAKTFEEHDVHYEPNTSENAPMSHVQPPAYTNVGDAIASRHQTRSQNASARQGDIDGLATLPSYGPADETYGPSSTVMFTRSIGPSEYTDQPGTPQPKHSEKSLPPLRDQDCVLPLRRSADDYLACFWNFTHPVFPVLHKPIFVAQYDRLWHADVAGSSSDDSYDERTFLAILNIIFALGSRSSSTIPAEESDSAANEFWDRSRRLFTYDILDRPSLGIVQLLLLSGVYLQSSQSASACWNTVGLAIRVAQSIGLHAEFDGGIQSGIRHKRIQLQTKRKMWHTLLAMSFGRPVMVTHASKVPLPIAVDDEYILDDGHSLQPVDTTSYMLLFVHSCKLFDILGAVLELHTADLPSTIPIGDLVDHTLKTNRQLEMFFGALPGELSQHALGTPERTGSVRLQQQVLLCRQVF